MPGMAERVIFAEVNRWVPGATLSTAGIHKRVAERETRIEPSERVQLAGNDFNSPTINHSVISSSAAARRLADTLTGVRSSRAAAPRDLAPTTSWWSRW